jgi:DNA-binding phage protein
MKPYIEFSDFLMQQLADSDHALQYLQIALEEYELDNDSEAFLLAVRDVAKAQGGMSDLSERTGLNRQSLYSHFD